MTPETLDVLGGWIGFVLTLLVFSYLLGDNVLYRLAIYAFVGVAAGYAAVVAVEGVLLPWLRSTMFAAETAPGEIALGFIPLFTGLLLLLKTSPRLARYGNLALAFLIGVGTAVALVGAVSGTLVPLVAATGTSLAGTPERPVDLNGIVIILGTVTSLLYFQYLATRRPDGSVQRPYVVRAVATVGQIFLIVTFASLYAGAIVSSLTIFSERIAFLLGQF
ncbi:MAG: hypothetical protein JW910_15860 [Anaerolineae bacterium]|nr:hypothetical protein [Anaerolineae bacterium]